MDNSKKRQAQQDKENRNKKGEKNQRSTVEDEDMDEDINEADPEFDDYDDQDLEEQLVYEEDDDGEMGFEDQRRKALEMIEKDNETLGNSNNDPKIQVFRPGVDQLEEDEVLDYDPTAYQMLHTLEPVWSCLSFDIIPDKMGPQRTRFPHTVYFAAGTQAENADQNRLILFKASRLCRTGYADVNEDDADADDDEDPILEFKFVKHQGCVNRVRVMPQEPHVVATWSDEGCVYLWNVNDQVKSLDFPPTGKLVETPIAQLTAHKAEGFAMAWSPLKPGRLVTGDVNSKLYLTELQNNTVWYQDTNAFTGHKSSIEDIEFSPSEVEVFATCSADKTVKIWDARKRKPAVSFQAASVDVNAISWNRKVNYLLASGADDGSFRIWDLRSIQAKNGTCESIAHFQWHNDQVTSIEWDPYDESTLAVSGADGQITIWDMSVEKDTETTDKNDLEDIPPQLMFVHQGQTDTKELHYHHQIPGVVISTAENGFDIFKPDIEAAPEEK